MSINTRTIIGIYTPVWPSVSVDLCHICPAAGSVLHLTKPHISLLSVHIVQSPVICIFLSDGIIVGCSVFRSDAKCHSGCYCILICQFCSTIEYRNGCGIRYCDIVFHFLYSCRIFIGIRNVHGCSLYFIVTVFQFFVRACNYCINSIFHTFIRKNNRCSSFYNIGITKNSLAILNGNLNSCINNNILQEFCYGCIFRKVTYFCSGDCIYIGSQHKCCHCIAFCCSDFRYCCDGMTKEVMIDRITVLVNDHFTCIDSRRILRQFVSVKYGRSGWIFVTSCLFVGSCCAWT